MNRRKTILLLMAAALLMTATVGGTLAYLFAQTDPVENIFEPGRVVPVIHEEFSGSVKNNVTISNSGNVNAYIRAAVVVTWKTADGKIAPVAPVEGTDYVISCPVDSKWTKHTDGYYYYADPVAPGGSTGVLLTGCKLKDGATPPDGCSLNVEILTQAIQAEGMGATGAIDAWAKAQSGN